MRNDGLTQRGRIIVVLREILLLCQDIIDAVVLVQLCVEYWRWWSLDSRIHHGCHRVVQISRGHLLHRLLVSWQLLRAASDVSTGIRRQISWWICDDRSIHLLLFLDKVSSRLRARDLLSLLSFFTSWHFLHDLLCAHHTTSWVLLITKFNLHGWWSMLHQDLLIWIWVAIRCHRGVSHSSTWIAGSRSNRNVGIAHLAWLCCHWLHALLVRPAAALIVLHYLWSVLILSDSVRFDSQLDWWCSGLLLKLNRARNISIKSNLKYRCHSSCISYLAQA